MSFSKNLEAVLFAVAKPVKLSSLAEWLEATPEDVERGLKDLEEHFHAEDRGLIVMRHGNEVELVTSPESAASVSKVLQAELRSELSRPALEALTVLAYCGPMTRAELEQIRGVQSSLILRNLLLRGLIEQKGEGALGQMLYGVTFAFLQHLGLGSIEELPDYEKLRGQEVLKQMSDHEAISASPESTLHS